jgi:hypothetical protein
MSNFRIRSTGLLLNAANSGAEVAVVSGQGAPSGGSLLDGASFGLYLRENTSNTETGVYLTVDSGTTWIAMAPAITSIPDPGDAAAIPVGVSANIAITTGGSGETNTLAIPTFAGQRLLLSLDVDGGGDRVVTVTGNVNAAGNNTITFATAGESRVLEAFAVAGALVWRDVGGDAALSTV